MRRVLVPLALLLALLAVAPTCHVDVPAGLLDALAQLDAAGGDAARADAAADVPPFPGADARPAGDAAACPTGAPCDDGDPCTVGDRCDDGLCRGPLPAVCDDGDPCTDDACAPGRGCVHAPLDGPECQPPLPCPTECADGNPCTVDDCDTRLGACRFAPLSGCRPCDPAGDWAETCDDDDPDTEDGCAEDPLLGGAVCTHVPLPCGLDPAVCDDGDPCTRDLLGRDCLCTHEALPGCDAR